MTSLSGNVFLLFVLLVPGFLFVNAFYMSGRLSRFDFQHGLLFDASALVGLSVAGHLVFGTLYFTALDSIAGRCQIADVLLANLLPAFAAPSPPPCGELIYLVAIAVYALLLAILAWALGRIAIRRIEDGTIRLRAFHGVYYEIICGKEDPVVLASIVTDLAYGNRIVVYEGIVQEIALTSPRRINSIALSAAKRFLMKIKDDTSEIDERHFNTIDDDKPAETIVVIPGEQIRNIVFRPFNVITGGDPGTTAEP